MAMQRDEIRSSQAEVDDDLRPSVETPSGNSSFLRKVTTAGSIASAIAGALNPGTPCLTEEHYPDTKPQTAIVTDIGSYDDNHDPSKTEKLCRDYLTLRTREQQHPEDPFLPSDDAADSSDPPDERFNLRLEGDTLVIEVPEEDLCEEEIASILADSSDELSEQADTDRAEAIPAEYEAVCDVLSTPSSTDISEEADIGTYLDTDEYPEIIEDA